MPDPTRYTILTQLKAALEAVTVVGGYWKTITTVDICATSPDDSEITSAMLPWIGIIPQGESYFEELSELRTEWAFDLLVYFDVTTRTQLGLALECTKFAHDLRKCIYANRTLGMNEVYALSLTKRTGAEGLKEAVRRGRGFITASGKITFLENYDAA